MLHRMCHDIGGHSDSPFIILIILYKVSSARDWESQVLNAWNRTLENSLTLNRKRAGVSHVPSWGRNRYDTTSIPFLKTRDHIIHHIIQTHPSLFPNPSVEVASRQRSGGRLQSGRHMNSSIDISYVIDVDDKICL